MLTDNLRIIKLIVTDLYKIIDTGTDLHSNLDVLQRMFMGLDLEIRAIELDEDKEMAGYRYDIVKARLMKLGAYGHSLLTDADEARVALLKDIMISIAEALQMLEDVKERVYR